MQVCVLPELELVVAAGDRAGASWGLKQCSTAQAGYLACPTKIARNANLFYKPPVWGQFSALCATVAAENGQVGRL